MCRSQVPATSIKCPSVLTRQPRVVAQVSSGGYFADATNGVDSTAAVKRRKAPDATATSGVDSLAR
jgi:hypothetical protein